MNAPAFRPKTAPPDDAEALAAARAGFWARWRRRVPSYAQAGQTIQADVLPVATPRHNESYRGLDGPHRQQVEALRAWIERRIAKELVRCEACMTPDEWAEHREWIEEHARGCLWEALDRRAAKGKI